MAGIEAEDAAERYLDVIISVVNLIVAAVNTVVYGNIYFFVVDILTLVETDLVLTRVRIISHVWYLKGLLFALPPSTCPHQYTDDEKHQS